MTLFYLKTNSGYILVNPSTITTIKPIDGDETEVSLTDGTRIFAKQSIVDLRNALRLEVLGGAL